MKTGSLYCLHVMQPIKAEIMYNYLKGGMLNIKTY